MEMKKKSSWEVSSANFRLYSESNFKWFISGIDRFNSYLHKDGTICGHCGPENFFDSEQEAEDFLNVWLKHDDREPFLYGGPEEFIKEKEMQV